MKVKLPIIGLVQTGSDTVKQVIKSFPNVLGAGFLDLSDRSLTSYTTVSSRLMESFRGWVYANVSVLAEEISKLEFELYKITYVKGEPEWVETHNNPLLDLLDKPNPFTTTSQLIYQIEAHLELGGDTFLLLDKPMNPTTLFILPPDKVTVNPGSSNDNYTIRDYTYRDTIGGKKIEETYPAELIIQIKNPNPNNPYRGKSVVEAAATTIDSNVLSEEYLKRFFTNNATPGMTLTSDSRLTKDDIERITADLRKSHGGAKNAFKTLLLGGGLKPVSVQHSNKEMEYVELSNSLRDTIMAMFKNTKASLGIVEDVNRANAEATLISWKQSVIKPKMNRIVDTLNEFLVPRFGTNLVLTFCDPVPEDRASDVEEVVKLFSTATNPMMTVNEARGIVELDPLPGEEYDTVSNRVQVPVDTLPKNLGNISLDKHMRRNKLYDEARVQKNIYQAARELAQKLIKSKKKDGTPAEPRKYRYLSNDAAIEYWSKQIKLTEVVERRFKERLDKFLVQLEEKTIQNLHQIVPKKYKKKATDPFDEENEIAAGIDLFSPLVLEIAELSGNEAYQMMKLAGIYSPSKAMREAIAKRVELFTGSFVQTDKDKLTSIIAQGIEEGQSIPQIESTIRSEFSDYRKNQSVKISRTEVLNASNAGALDAFKESGVVEGKQWLTAGNPCPICEPYDGVVVSLDSGFYSSDNAFDDGDPPLHPNCRCVILPVLGNGEASVSETNRLKSELQVKDLKISEQKEYIEELEKFNEVN